MRNQIFAIIVALVFVVVPSAFAHDNSAVYKNCTKCHEKAVGVSQATARTPVKPVAPPVVKVAAQSTAKAVARVEAKMPVKADVSKAVVAASKAATPKVEKAAVKKFKPVLLSDGYRTYQVAASPINGNASTKKVIKAFPDKNMSYKMLLEYEKGVTEKGKVNMGQKFVWMASFPKGKIHWGEKLQVGTEGEFIVVYYGKPFIHNGHTFALGTMQVCKNTFLVEIPPVKVVKQVAPKDEPIKDEPIVPEVAPKPVEELEEEVLVIPPPPVPDYFPEEPKVKTTFDWSSCNELTVGTGVFKSLGRDNTGIYSWLHDRCLPVSLTDDLKLGFNFGAVAFKGTDVKYDYKGTRLYAGPSMAYETAKSRSTYDLGLAYQFDDGSEGAYAASQKDWQIRIGLGYDNWENRMSEVSKFIPKYNLSFAGIYALTADKTATINGGASKTEEAWDNTFFEAMATVGIWDFKSPSKRWTFMPAVKLGTGYESGPKNPYVKVGPALEIEFLGHKIMDVGAMQYKANFGNNLKDQVEYVNVMIDVGSISGLVWDKLFK